MNAPFNQNEFRAGLHSWADTQVRPYGLKIVDDMEISGMLGWTYVSTLTLMNARFNQDEFRAGLHSWADTQVRPYGDAV